MPSPTYISRFRDFHAHHRFSPLTAFLSVNYFDRFLSPHSLPRVVTVSAAVRRVLPLSLAAKMEAPNVPFILDLQIFEPKTVQRMELRVMGILNWRLRSIIPFDFLHHFVSDLPSSSSSLLSASSDLVLSTILVIDFLGFSPSTIAAAAGNLAVIFLFSWRSTCSTRCRCSHHKQPSIGSALSAPGCPIGVLDAAACSSCDTRFENPESTIQAGRSTKRLRPSAAADVQLP
ncbi:cyclin-D4-1-like [Pyrus ussuriensis x Pyrus communis]|uniref:B-like cyclin n=1 Tax=Pyrus ussuriensis x Pyrus communis TaxID=2448454 RepID=A0A5N5IAB2_9ROSA|nr:cyclin-D4-1-like [Pyrus ussuriensis x Pyrus communis]